MNRQVNRADKKTSQKTETKKKGRIRKVLGASTAILAIGVMVAQAQTGNMISRAQLVGATGPEGCPVILVNFRSPLSLTSQVMSANGNVLTVRLAAPSNSTTGAAIATPIETEPAMNIPGIGAAFVTLDTNGPFPILKIRFSGQAEATVSQAGERSIVIAVNTPEQSAACRATRNTGPAAPVVNPAPSTLVELPAAPDSTAGTDGATGQDAEALDILTQARTAVISADYAVAVQLLTKIQEMPENRYSPDAQELLGVVRERNGQFAHAKAEYEIYLAKYPDLPGAERVRQRLAALLTAQMVPPELRAAGDGYQGPRDPARPGGGPSDTVPANWGGSVPRQGETFRPLGPQPGFAPLGDTGGFVNADGMPVKEEPTFRGTVSGYYYLNQSSTVITELTTNDTTTDDEVLQNNLVLSFDMSDKITKDAGIFSWRFNGDYDVDFTGSDGNRIGLSRLYAGYQFGGEDGLEVQFGRQSRHDGGVLGRFDGLQVTFPVNDTLDIKAVAGLPVDSKRDELFSGNRTLLGVSADLTELWTGVDISGFAVTEMREGYSNRLAVGMEGQYSTDDNTAYGLIDYDLNFGAINIARLNWTHINPDKSTISVGAEYSHSPVFALSNALTGEVETTLQALTTTYSDEQIKQMAEDKTTEMAALTLSYQRPLNDTWQLGADATVNYTNGNPASGIVPAVEAPGLEYYTSVQMVGSSVFTENDVVNVSVQYANSASSDLFLVDSYIRYNLTDEIKIRPRIKIARREFDDRPDAETYAIPSLSATYSFNRDLDFEVELGTRISDQSSPLLSTETNETYATIGFTKSF